ncbi:MAG TPA: AlpA family phage regulatory protein [Stellaceae bacterium]|nr:AlpA family phage regulatory protein [Stellaceae bacterium]
MKEKQSRLLRFREIRERGCPSRASVSRRVRDGSFPAPVQIGEHSIAWREHEIEQWLANRPRVSYAPAAAEPQSKPVVAPARGRPRRQPQAAATA